MHKAFTRVLAIVANPATVPDLDEQPFEIETTSDFAEGLRRVATRLFELVLLDLQLPGTAGLDAFIKLQAAAPQVAVILLTDTSRDELGHEALRLGAQDFLDPRALTAPALAIASIKAVERHRAQAASRRDRHLLEILMDKIPDAIYFKDAESRFLRVSQAQARRFNLTDPALAIGRTDADFFSGAHATQARADEERTMRTGEPLVGFEEMETWPDGSISWVSTTKMPLRDPTGKIIGTFGISRDITSRKLAELALAEKTRQLEQKNQQIEEELRMARELQVAMLPQEFPRVPPHEESALEFFSFYFPSGAVSGDFFDVVELSDTAVGVFICDVMGHDVRAALVTAMMRSLVEDLSHSTRDPGELLAQINRGLNSVFKRTGATMFATAFYLIADVGSGELVYASAAHPDALHLRREQNQVVSLDSGNGRKGPALGLFQNAEFPTCRRRLNAGDVLVLFTDGLTEAEGADEECFTQERLATAVRERVHLPSGQMLEQVLAEIKDFCGSSAFADDASLVGIEIKRVGISAPAR